MHQHGQQPLAMIISCCDSRVNPTELLQTAPGELFVVRSVANLVPPFSVEGSIDSTAAALEFGLCGLNIPHLIIMGHSQCGGIQALVNPDSLEQDDTITRWVSSTGLSSSQASQSSPDEYAKQALHHSFQQCFTYPWIKTRFDQGKLHIHRWFFDIASASIWVFNEEEDQFKPFA